MCKSFIVRAKGFAYNQGWHIGTDKRSAIGFGQISVLNISYILVKPLIEYQLSVSVKHRTDKISVIGFGQISVIGYLLNSTDMPSLLTMLCMCVK